MLNNSVELNMKPPIAIAIHVMTLVTTATTLSVAHGLMSVYLLGNVDSKFGAAGTVQLIGMIALLCSSVAAVGSGLFHFFWLRKSIEPRLAMSICSGGIIGGLLAAIHKLVLFNVPILPGVSDWQQQCVYFLILGYLLHAISAPIMNMLPVRRS